MFTSGFRNDFNSRGGNRGNQGRSQDITLTPAQWDSSNLTVFQKNFYRESPVVKNRPIVFC